MEEQIRKELYEKMNAEQDAYRAKLLAMPPEEILKHTWEYNAKVDILTAVDSSILAENQMRALLKSPCPLADVVKEYRDMDTHNEEILAAFEEAAKLHMEPPIYRQSAQYAMEHGEREAYFASRRSFEACGRAIDESIDKHFDGMYLSKDAVREVLEEFSTERVNLVLACTVKHKEWDLRFSRGNREWAKTVDTTCLGKEPYYCMSRSHPAILDGFISTFREQILGKEKGSQNREKPVKHERERSDDIEL
ncbi:DUF3849 domain-containing protein [Oscillospiraceae bacterium 21-37]